MHNLDILIPVKNEAENLPVIVKLVHETLKDADISHKIILIIDKSTDGTLQVAHNLNGKYPVIVHEKIGQPGKAFSILEGSNLATAPFIGFIDGDLQYPPQALPEMFRKVQNANVGVVVANRKNYKSASKMRKLGSRANALIFGRLLLGLHCDIQSGLKVFRREIVQHIDTTLVSAWTIDIPLLHATRELGYKIEQVDIDFENRANGASHIGFFKTAWAIAKCAITVKLRESRPYIIKTSDSYLGTGVVYKKKKFVTHNGLPHHRSALYTLQRNQKIALTAILIALAISFYFYPYWTALILVGILSFIYFFDMVFNFFLVHKSLRKPPELQFSHEELAKISDKELPLYTILCPLYKEWQVISHFVDHIQRLDWPKDKLEVLLLLEENDAKTIEVAQSLELPDFVQIVIVPHSMPKTKPKACNYGLHIAKGEYVVVYDAEDQPESLQLKKAFLAFQNSPANTFCVQAKLNYYNHSQNLLTKLFTAEYSLWFDVILPSLQSINTTIPLGGTSNHFKTKALLNLHGWDPFNVTEDCDLGVRLFKDGFQTAIIDSVTLEEANSNVHNWIRQRSRWLKGYMQTYFVHMRDPYAFVRKHGMHALVFQLIIGLRISFILINPLLWAATLSYFTLYNLVGPTIEALYPAPIFYMAATSLIFGNFMYLYNYMIGLAKRQQWSLIKYVYFVPFYWLITSVAAVMAFWQLIFKPHHWEKTVHGLHLSKKTKDKDKDSGTKAIPFVEKSEQFADPNAHKTGMAFVNESKPKIRFLANATFWNGSVLIGATVAANFANFVYNAFLGRQVDLSQFGTVSLISNIFAIAAVFSGALGKAVSYKTAFIMGKTHALDKNFYFKVRRNTWMFSIVATILWILASPILATFFNEANVLPFILFTPYWLISFVGSVNSGFLSGAHKFAILGVSMLVEALSKVLIAVIAVQTGMHQVIYAVIPLSVFLAFVYEALVVSRIKTHRSEVETDYHFPTGFYVTSIFTKISTVIFLSADVILAKHYLNPTDAGKYALLSLTGKIVYFMGNMFSQFIIPVVSKEEGRSRKSTPVFYKLLAGSSVMALLAYIGIGTFGYITVPILFGNKTQSILPLLPAYALAMVVYSISYSIVSYHQVKKHYLFTAVPLLFGLAQIAFITMTHGSIEQFVSVISTLSLAQLIYVLILHGTYTKLVYFATDVFEFFRSKKTVPGQNRGLNILIYNWRDTKHIWAGGAEVYVQEMAKRWVEDGHNVTLFCGSDRKSPNNETLDGINVIRRGGFFTVYLWAFVYYIFKFRGKFDVILDSENGIPFFTPLFCKEPVVLLIHHVHKDIILSGLRLPKYLLPLAFVAKQLETKMMPIIYRNSTIVAVSESTKNDLVKIGFDNIHIVNPGVDIDHFKPAEKYSNPLVLYLGRLRYYKSIDTLLRAHKKVLKKVPNARLAIAGFGEARGMLEDYAKKLNIQDTVEFLGKVSEEQKQTLLARSWVFAYPSTMEGWGISIIEASASGTPVVASNVPGLKDSVKNPHTGYLVEKGNAVDFAKQITELLLNKDLRSQMGRAGVNWAENFTWDKGSSNLLSIFTKTINDTVEVDNGNSFALEGNS
jgi:glycosyltransferase XagB